MGVVGGLRILIACLTFWGVAMAASDIFLNFTELIGSGIGVGNSESIANAFIEYTKLNDAGRAYDIFVESLDSFDSFFQTIAETMFAQAAVIADQFQNVDFLSAVDFEVVEPSNMSSLEYQADDVYMGQGINYNIATPFLPLGRESYPAKAFRGLHYNVTAALNAITNVTRSANIPSWGRFIDAYDGTMFQFPTVTNAHERYFFETRRVTRSLNGHKSLYSRSNVIVLLDQSSSYSEETLETIRAVGTVLVHSVSSQCSLGVAFFSSGGTQFPKAGNSLLPLTAYADHIFTFLESGPSASLGFSATPASVAKALDAFDIRPSYPFPTYNASATIHDFSLSRKPTNGSEVLYDPASPDSILMSDKTRRLFDDGQLDATPLFYARGIIIYVITPGFSSLQGVSRLQSVCFNKDLVFLNLASKHVVFKHTDTWADSGSGSFSNALSFTEITYADPAVSPNRTAVFVASGAPLGEADGAALPIEDFIEASDSSNNLAGRAFTPNVFDNAREYPSQNEAESARAELYRKTRLETTRKSRSKLVQLQKNIQLAAKKTATRYYSVGCLAGNTTFYNSTRYIDDNSLFTSDVVEFASTSWMPLKFPRHGVDLDGLRSGLEAPLSLLRAPNGSLIVSNIFIDLFGLNQVISFTVPVYAAHAGASYFLGSLSLTLPFRLPPFAAASALDPLSFFTLFKSDGMVLYHPFMEDPDETVLSVDSALDYTIREIDKEFGGLVWNFIPVSRTFYGDIDLRLRAKSSFMSIDFNAFPHGLRYAGKYFCSYFTTVQGLCLCLLSSPLLLHGLEAPGTDGIVSGAFIIACSSDVAATAYDSANAEKYVCVSFSADAVAATAATYNVGEEVAEKILVALVLQETAYKAAGGAGAVVEESFEEVESAEISAIVNATRVMVRGFCAEFEDADTSGWHAMFEYVEFVDNFFGTTLIFPPRYVPPGGGAASVGASQALSYNPSTHVPAVRRFAASGALGTYLTLNEVVKTNHLAQSNSSSFEVGILRRNYNVMTLLDAFNAGASAFGCEFPACRVIFFDPYAAQWAVRAYEGTAEAVYLFEFFDLVAEEVVASYVLWYNGVLRFEEFFNIYTLEYCSLVSADFSAVVGAPDQNVTLTLPPHCEGTVVMYFDTRLSLVYLLVQDLSCSYVRSAFSRIECVVVDEESPYFARIPEIRNQTSSPQHFRISFIQDLTEASPRPAKTRLDSGEQTLIVLAVIIAIGMFFLAQCFTKLSKHLRPNY
eukprot:gnl/Chilomastix_cuspidata/3454.p1 GENE.gnl/Chilomastix_cuspidata/3454~~gnl/Chilomastix_cuspidata/3454.p1  ORF type:complete len:1253 (-),score=515.99 gnl/Chilomastix_cuspidata/3454:152-3862(-)